MKVKSVEELKFMSEELQRAYVAKCADYWEKNFMGKDWEKMNPEEQEEDDKLRDIFRYARINLDD